MSCGGEAAGEASDGEAIFVALGTDFKKGKAILQWVFRHLPRKEVVILHVHKPPKLIPMHRSKQQRLLLRLAEMGGKFPISMASTEEAAIYIEARRAKMNALIYAYIRFCAEYGVSAKKLVIETDDAFRGIVYVVGRHQIKKLVLGLKSIKDEPILDGGLLACQIWLVYNGNLVFSREALLQRISVEFRDDGQCHFTSSPESSKEHPSPRSAKETSLIRSPREESKIGSSNKTSTSSSSKETSTSSSFTEMSTPKSLRELLSQKSVEEIAMPNIPKEESMPKSFKAASKLHQCSVALPANKNWWMKEAPTDLSSKGEEEAELGLSSKETFEAEDIGDLTAQLAEAVQVIFRQRLEMARQILTLKQEFIEFSVSELEEAAQRLNADRGRRL